MEPSGDELAASAATDEAAEFAELVALAERIGELCRSAGITIALGESCTGGLVGHLVTEIPGASAYLRGGVVAYADAAKEAFLDVPPGALSEHGAVSAQVALAMAAGARGRFEADVGIAVTGISGPSGGSPQKPVGLTYVAVADAAGSTVRRFVWQGDRSANKRASARATLDLLIERLTAPS